jgi:hypothetical protein
MRTGQDVRIAATGTVHLFDPQTGNLIEVGNE